MPTVNVQIHNERFHMYTTWEGYFLSRNLEEFPGWAALPFKDFYECLDGSHKKMWLDIDGRMKEGRLTTKVNSMVPLYQGIGDTMRLIVSRAFFWYSASITTTHFAILDMSRKYGAAPNLPALLAVADEADHSELQERVLVARIVAFLIYEGDGLGGYSDKVWAFWGRMNGIGCPTNPSILSDVEAQDCQKQWNEAKPVQRRELFVQWWQLVHPETPEHLVRRVFMLDSLVGKYQALESGAMKMEPEHLPAAICGFLRRSSQGRNEPTRVRLGDILAERLDDVEEFLSDCNGPSAFGRVLIGTIRIHEMHARLVDGVNAREEVDESRIRDFIADGLPTSIRQR